SARHRMEYVSGMTPDDRLETSFTRMVDATSEDYAIIARHALGFTQGLPDRILRHLALLAGDTGGYAVDRLTHSLQTATRDHTHWQACADFCAAYDQNSFDPGYDTLSLEFFEPMVRRVFAAPKRSLYLPSDVEPRRVRWGQAGPNRPRQLGPGQGLPAAPG